MIRRKRYNFARVGTVALALVLAMGIMGMGYGVWSDVVNIRGTVDTGTYGVELSDLSCPEQLVCDAIDNVLYVKNGTNIEVSEEYDCIFTVSNTGTVPIKIDISPDSPFNPAPGVTVTVEDSLGGSFDGVQIELESPKDAIVHVSFTEGASTTFDFDVTFNFAPWNQ